MGLAEQIEIYEYPEESEAPAVLDWSALSGTLEADDVLAESQKPERQPEAIPAPVNPAAFELQLEEAKRRAFEEGRARGLQEGRQAERETHAAAAANAEQKWQRHAAQVVERFATERARYFEEVEQDVVRLALAVASRILRREAQMDPLMLTGAVRVALGQLAGTTEVRLKVPPAELEMWADAMRLLPNLAAKPTVVAGEGMRLGDCVVETNMGSVDLGVRSQLGEIESGFFDRAGGGRPARPSPQKDAAGTEQEARQ